MFVNSSQGTRRGACMFINIMRDDYIILMVLSADDPPRNIVSGVLPTGGFPEWVKYTLPSPDFRATIV